MRTAIISSSKDNAGINIRNSLIRLFGFEKTNEGFDNNDVFQYKNQKKQIVKLYLANNDLIFLEEVDKRIDADAFIFASKHSSKGGKASFSVHSVGNWGEAEFGGKAKSLCMSSAVLLKNLFIELNEIGKEKLGYEITMESTHHGPYLEKPAVFVEIGSTEKEWNDKENGKIIAETILNAFGSNETNFKTAIGIGGPHYCSNFNKVVLRTDIAISHICPKYSLERLDEDLIKQSIQKTVEKADFILLDWKGLGAEKQRIAEMLKNLNLEIKRIDNLLKS